MPEWTSICLCLTAIFGRATTCILGAFYFADIGITTNTTSNVSSTCVVLALVAGHQNFQPRPATGARVFSRQLSETADSTSL